MRPSPSPSAARVHLGAHETMSLRSNQGRSGSVVRGSCTDAGQECVAVVEDDCRARGRGAWSVCERTASETHNADTVGVHAPSHWRHPPSPLAASILALALASRVGVRDADPDISDVVVLVELVEPVTADWCRRTVRVFY